MLAVCPVCLSWCWLVLTSVLSVKAVAVGSSQCRYHHTTELEKDRSGSRDHQDSPLQSARPARPDVIRGDGGVCIQISLLPGVRLQPDVSPVK